MTSLLRLAAMRMAIGERFATRTKQCTTDLSSPKRDCYPHTRVHPEPSSGSSLKPTDQQPQFYFRRNTDMSGNWINFRELRSKLAFAEVLKHYGKEMSEKNGQLVGFCPLPSHGN